MSWISSYIKRLLLEVVAMAILGTGILIAMGASMYIAGWIWGACGSLVYCLVLAIHVMKSFQLAPAAVPSYIRRTAGVRLLVAVAFLLFAVYFDSMEILSTGAGLLLYRLAVYVDYFLVRPWSRTDDYHS